VLQLVPLLDMNPWTIRVAATGQLKTFADGKWCHKWVKLDEDEYLKLNKYQVVYDLQFGDGTLDVKEVRD